MLSKEADIKLLSLMARMHSSDLVAMAIKSTSEEQTLADTLTTLGIDHYRHHSLGHASAEKEKIDPQVLQKYLIDNGYNLTIHSCTGIVAGPLVHVFYCGSPEFTKEGIENGSFLFTLNRDSGVYTKHKTGRTLTATE